MADPTLEHSREMQDGFGRPIDEDLYWRNTGLSEASIEEIKEYERQKVLRGEPLGSHG